MFTRLSLCVAAAFFAAGHGPAHSQTLPQKIAMVKMQRDVDAEVAAQRAGVSSRVALRSGLQVVALENTSLKNAIDWLHNVSGLNIIVHWPSLSDIGVTPETPVSIVGANMTAETALNQVIKQIAPEQNLVWEVTPWYVEIMTKAQANGHSVTLVYPIGDLLQTVPNFTDAPSFDLSAITSGGGGKGGGASPFAETQSTADGGMSRTEHAEKIAELIRTTIEPEIWKEAGGTAGSISFYRESLVIRAPMYVHRQIGGYTPLAGRASAIGVGAVAGGNGVAAFDPKLGVVNSGNVMDVVGSTSDGRYVTLSGGFSNAVVNSIRTVPVQAAVGGGGYTNTAPPAGLRYGSTFRTAGIGR